MQDKHVVIFRASEDRDIFINKCTLPKTVYQIVDRGTPEEGDIVVGNQQSIDWIIAQHIIDNYDNLPEYTIFTSADPRDHAVSLETAIHCKFTSGFGSFCFSRAIYSQYTFEWFRIHPIRMLANLLGLGMHNDNNINKLIYFFEPGTIFYVHRDRILQHPKSFYENMVYWDNDPVLKEEFIKHQHPDWFWKDLSLYNPETKSNNKKEILEKSVITNSHHGTKQDFYGITCEPLWPLTFKSKKVFNRIEKAQATVGNKLYFNTNFKKYNPNLEFNLFPFDLNQHKIMFNFLYFENDWFDYEDQTYLDWREKILEKLHYEYKKFKGESWESFWNRTDKSEIKNNEKISKLIDMIKEAGLKHIYMINI